MSSSDNDDLEILDDYELPTPLPRKPFNWDEGEVLLEEKIVEEVVIPKISLLSVDTSSKIGKPVPGDGSQSRYWVFTLNNPSKDLVKNFATKLMEGYKFCTYVVYQYERASTGTPHLQGYFACKNNVRFNTIKKLIKTHTGSLPYLAMRRATHDESVHYCSKPVKDCCCKHCEEKPVRISGPFVLGDDSDIPKNESGRRTDLENLKDDIFIRNMPIHEIKQFHFGSYLKYGKFIGELVAEREKEVFYLEAKKDNHFKPENLRPHQKKMLEIVDKMNKKNIVWFYDIVGQIGKSHLADVLSFHYGAYQSSNIAKKDSAYLYEKENLVVFNFTRSNDGYISYQMLEQYADGRVTSTKYTPNAKWVLHGCKVVCFANSPPEPSISEGRFQVYNVSSGQLGWTIATVPYSHLKMKTDNTTKVIEIDV